MLGRLFVVAVLVIGSAACQKTQQAPAIPEAAAPLSPPPPPPPPPPTVNASDAAAVADGGASGDAAPARHGKKQPVKPRAAGGGAAGGIKVEGGLPVAEATAVVRGGRARLQACFDEAVAANPKLAGKVTFRLTVDERGRVSLGEVVTSTLGGGDPELCMIRATRSFKFPTGTGGVVGFQMVFGK